MRTSIFVALTICAMVCACYAQTCSQYEARLSSCPVTKLATLTQMTGLNTTSSGCVSLDFVYVLYRKYYENTCQWDNWNNAVTSHYFGTLYSACDVNNDGMICTNENPQNVCQCLATCKAIQCASWGIASYLNNNPISNANVDVSERTLSKQAMWTLYH